jgi:predicted AAA+ superfamily ATPase
MIARNLCPLLAQTKKSVLLLGPRQVGKSTLLHSLKPDLELNLADEEVFLRFTADPGELTRKIETANPRTVFLDEVQRYPALLNTVQALADKNKNLKFYLSGSSARKLKRGQANLLPGRVLNFFLGGLVSSELNYSAPQELLMRFGSLPEVYLEAAEKNKKAILRSYVSTYLLEEIRAEALLRNIAAFSRALPFAIQTSGQFIDYSKLSKLAKVSRHSLSRFYEIFEDTLIGYRLWPDETLQKKADLVKHPKFFVFDLGIYNTMAGTFDLSEDRKGILFEHLVLNQILHSAWSKDFEVKVSTFRTRGGLEVDFILTLEGKRYAIEAKASSEFAYQGVGPLKKLKNDYEKGIQVLGVHLGTKSQKVDGVWCHPWQVMLKELGL